ncbi:uncharacterized protein LOC131673790 [Phymastichus coffea]|uniref:uncharacterized protein LOC131673790 n=1 Tax=Phymastichus coffea TaxID=108790 RepID=UPI00273B318D|nr:uncharacterized protein LOC131673790 [Phymastichus coffea]
MRQQPDEDIHLFFEKVKKQFAKCAFLEDCRDWILRDKVIAGASSKEREELLAADLTSSLQDLVNGVSGYNNRNDLCDVHDTSKDLFSDDDDEEVTRPSTYLSSSSMALEVTPSPQPRPQPAIDEGGKWTPPQPQLRPKAPPQSQPQSAPQPQPQLQPQPQP